MSAASRRIPFAIVSSVVVALVVAVAGCGGDGGGSSYGRSASPAEPASGSHLTIKLARTKLGKVLADGHGHTLYLFRSRQGPDEHLRRRLRCRAGRRA